PVRDAHAAADLAAGRQQQRCRGAAPLPGASDLAGIHPAPQVPGDSMNDTTVTRFGAAVALMALLLTAIGCRTAGVALAAPPGGAKTTVELLRTPDGGVQPQAAVDGRGVVHLV